MATSGFGNLDGRLDRRTLLRLGGVSAATVMLGTGALSSERSYAAPAFQNDPFSLGVASGDPLPDSVVLWTRLAPDPLAEDGHGGMPQRPVRVRYEVAEDESFRFVVRRGSVEAAPELAHSVHAEVSGLRPGREYFYRFKAGRAESPVGRTKTTPAFGASVSSLSFAFASCQAWPDGYYAAYRHMAGENDLDLVVHLGDYIYEYGIPADGGRRGIAVPDYFTTETVSLKRYRTQYALYKSDPDLQAAHAVAPWLVTLDDHEVENGWADDVPEQNTLTPTRAEFLERRASAFRAFYEHLPLRSSALPVGPDMRLYRRLAYGDLAEFSMLDTRQYRDELPRPDTDDRYDPSRTLTGDEQERWLLDGMSASHSRWNVIAQQIRVAEFDHGSESDPNLPKDGWEGLGADCWDGYIASRDRVFGGIAERGVSNPVVLTGDWHRNLVADIKADYRDPGSATIASELVGTSISSGGDGQDIDNLGRAGLIVNPHVKFYNIQRGYVMCRLDAQRWTSEFKVLPQVSTPDAAVSTRATYVIEEGRPGAQPV